MCACVCVCVCVCVFTLDKHEYIHKQMKVFLQITFTNGTLYLVLQY